MMNYNTSGKNRFIDNDNGTILDSFTGLMWQEGYAYRETGNYISWYDANDYIEKLNQQKLGKYYDWRLPNKLEIQSLYEVTYHFYHVEKHLSCISILFLSLDMEVVSGLVEPDFQQLLDSSLMPEIHTGILRVVCLQLFVRSGLIAIHQF